MSEPKKLVKIKNPKRVRIPSQIERERIMDNYRELGLQEQLASEKKWGVIRNSNRIGTEYRAKERNSFYTKPGRYSEVSRFDRTSNRRAASRYIPNA